MSEKQYLDLVQNILDRGVSQNDRTGVGTRSIWGSQLRFDLSVGFPLLTTRFISFKIAFEETMFFLRGETDTKKLEAIGINIWKGNTSRDFLDKRGLRDLPEGDMGKGYGHQIRNFNGFDQLQYLVDNIKSNPSDRRHLMCYWNPKEVLTEAALPPCHYSYNVQVADGKLNAMFNMRSSDVICGAPYNVAGYALLTHIIAKLTGYEVGDLIYSASDCHIYTNHIDGARELLGRAPLNLPTFKFLKDFSTLEEALELKLSDIELTGYNHGGKMAFSMAI